MRAQIVVKTLDGNVSKSSPTEELTEEEFVQMHDQFSDIVTSKLEKLSFELEDKSIRMFMPANIVWVDVRRL